jgi:hypothetical protein
MGTAEVGITAGAVEAEEETGAAELEVSLLPGDATPP